MKIVKENYDDWIGKIQVIVGETGRVSADLGPKLSIILFTPQNKWKSDLNENLG